MTNPLNNGSISWNNWSYLQHKKAFGAFAEWDKHTHQFVPIKVHLMSFIPVSQAKLDGIIRRQKAKGIIN